MIFIDSSAIIALAIKGDINYKIAFDTFAQIKNQRAVIATDIISESLNVLCKRCSPAHVCSVGSAILEDEALGNIVEFTFEDRLSALKILNKYQDQQLSYVDALSFAFIHRLKITQVFSFDSDFNLLKGITNLAHKR